LLSNPCFGYLLIRASKTLKASEYRATAKLSRASTPSGRVALSVLLFRLPIRSLHLEQEIAEGS
jgi:hypothetical protein